LVLFLFGGAVLEQRALINKLRHSGMRYPNSGLPEFGIINVQVGNSRLGCAGPESIDSVVVMDSGLAPLSDAHSRDRRHAPE
jgi:hypothetical protein